MGWNAIKEDFPPDHGFSKVQVSRVVENLLFGPQGHFVRRVNVQNAPLFGNVHLGKLILHTSP